MGSHIIRCDGGMLVVKSKDGLQLVDRLTSDNKLYAFFSMCIEYWAKHGSFEEKTSSINPQVLNTILGSLEKQDEKTEDISEAVREVASVVASLLAIMKSEGFDTSISQYTVPPKRESLGYDPEATIVSMEDLENGPSMFNFDEDVFGDEEPGSDTVIIKETVEETTVSEEPDDSPITARGISLQDIINTNKALSKN